MEFVVYRCIEKFLITVDGPRNEASMQEAIRRAEAGEGKVSNDGQWIVFNPIPDEEISPVDLYEKK